MKKSWEKRDVLLKLDRSAEFLDHKVILQKPEQVCVLEERDT